VSGTNMEGPRCHRCDHLNEYHFRIQYLDDPTPAPCFCGCTAMIESAQSEQMLEHDGND
jgi:hypothetical protein